MIDYKKSEILKVKNDLILSNTVPDEFKLNSNLSFSFKWIHEVNPTHVLNIRNQPHVLLNMKRSEPITVSEHKYFISKYKETERFDFICFSDLDFCEIGAINIVKSRYGWELGKYIGNVNYLGKKISIPMTKTFFNYIRNEVKIFFDKFIDFKS